MNNLLDEIYKEADYISEDVIGYFENTEDEISKDIIEWFLLYNITSYLDANKLLTKDELYKFKRELRQFERENVPDSWKKRIEVQLSRSRISRIDKLKFTTQHKLERLFKYYKDVVDELLKESYEKYYKGLVDNDEVVITKPFEEQPSWTPDGVKYDERLENNKNTLVFLLLAIITRSILRPVDLSVKEIQKELKKAGNNAHTLITTEQVAYMGFASLAALTALGHDYYKFVAVLDSRTTPLCRSMNGKVFPVKEMKIGVNVPPLHVNCYDKETEIYTNNGWKLFKDLSEDDLVYTIDKDTLIPEWQKPIEYISYHYTGNLMYFKHERVDLMVTPNHNLLVQNKDHDVKSRNFKLRAANTIGVKAKNRMIGGCEWEGQHISSVTLGGKEVDIETYIKFMAYWLADGSCSKHRNSYAIKIAQTNNDWMYEELKNFPFKIYNGKEGLIIHDLELGKDLLKYGKSTTKYVPEIIKTLSKELIEIFLIAYSKTDGSVKKGKFWKGYQFKDSICFFTSSNKLAGDLGELIMKVGGRPSFTLQEVKGKQQTFRNGTYTINEDCWVIHWNKQKYSWINNMQVTNVSYDDLVYCVEVEKHNTLLVRRNGKVLWCGNCRSHIEPVTKKELRK